MASLGQKLAEARNRKGISIREASDSTKIRGDYLTKFENDDFYYTEEDVLVIRGLAQSVRDKSITSLIQDVNIKPEDDPQGLLEQEHIDNPENITDPDVFVALDATRHAHIWGQLKDKALNPKKHTTKSPHTTREQQENT